MKLLLKILVIMFVKQPTKLDLIDIFIRRVLFFFIIFVSLGLPGKNKIRAEGFEPIIIEDPLAISHQNSGHISVSTGYFYAEFMVLLFFALKNLETVDNFSGGLFLRRGEMVSHGDSTVK